jgi:uncharacterized protein YxjI
MHPILNHNLYFVREKVGFFKASNSYDILDPNTQQIIMTCNEENLGWFTKMLRFTKDYKTMTPFDVMVRGADGSPVVNVKRGWTFFVSKVDVMDENNQRVGGFKQKWFSLGGAFTVLDANDQPLCTLQGKWTGWEFTFKQGEQEYAKVTKKWAGLGKELFTSADNYILEINQGVPQNHPLRILIMAAVMCIDLVLKER